MSKIKTIDIPCPHCKEKNPFTIYQSVNVDISPELKEKTLKGEIFNYHCEHCNKDSTIPYPMLYNDMTNKFMVYFADINQIEEFEFMNQDENELIQKVMSNITRRGVTTWQDFIEKVTILENGYDDRIVEIVKFNAIKCILQENKKEKIHNVVIGDLTEDKLLKYIIFTDKANTQGFGLTITKEIYEDELKIYGEWIKHYDNCIVDKDFIEKLIDDKHNSLPDELETDYRELIGVYDSNNVFHICMKDYTFKKELSINDHVVIETKNDRLRAKVVKIKKVLNSHLPKYCSKYDKIVSVIKNGDEIQKEVFNENEIDIETLNNALKEYKDKPNVGNFMKLMDALSKRYLLMPVTIEFSNEDIEQFKNSSKGNTISLNQDAPITTIKFTDDNGKQFACLHTEQSKAEKVEPTSVLRLWFTDALDMINKIPHINGVVINPNDEKIIITFDMLRPYLERLNKGENK